MSPPVSLALLFVEMINRHDVHGLLSLMSEDHRFIDAQDAVVTGRDALQAAWLQYFAMVPDYRLELAEVMEEGYVVGMFGRASGTLAVKGALPPENRWSIPAAVRATVRDDRVSEWRVYADNTPVFELMKGKR